MITLTVMLGRNGVVDFSPLLGMAYLCEFATSWAPTEIPSRRSNGTSGLPSNNGTSQLLNQIPASSGKRSRLESKLYIPVQAVNQGNSASTFTIKSNAFITDERLPKRRKAASHRDPSIGVLPTGSTTPCQPFSDFVSDEHPWELRLPWEPDDEIIFSPTASQDREHFSFFHEVNSLSKLRVQLGKEDGDQKSATQQSTTLHLLESTLEPDGVEVMEPFISSSEFLSVAAVPVSGTAPQRSHIANLLSVGELKLFPSSDELASATNSRSMEALVTWYQRLRELIEFERLHGHQKVPQKSTLFPKLGTWVNKQRSQRHGLSSEKVAALEAVCFDWGEKLGMTGWRMRFNALVAYRAKYGDCTFWGDVITS